MGVPAYFRWLTTRYEKSIIRSVLPRDRLTGSVVLYLDFNGAIHPAVRSDPGIKRQDMNAAVCAYLENILKFVRPDEIFLAIDGVAPTAKMNQQRDRRYKSVKEAHNMRVLNAKHKKDPPVETDFNMISPGTEFMTDLQTALEAHIKSQSQTSELWRGLKKITLSGANVPGEGEHKIMDEIRRRGSNGSTGSTGSNGSNGSNAEHPVVYGLDADLIFLSMLNHPKIVLVRETTYFDKPGDSAAAEAYSYLDIQELTAILLKILDRKTGLDALGKLGVKNVVATDHPPSGPSGPSDPVRLIRDYAFMCFLLGNDFIPHLPSLRIRDDSLADLIVFYKITAWAHADDGYLLSPGLDLNYPFFSEFMREIAYVENEVLQGHAETRRKSIRRFKERVKQLDPYTRERENYTYVEDKYDDCIQLGEPGWRVRYYKEHLNLVHTTDALFQAQIFRICKNYLEGCLWVIRYYLGQTDNWDYQYNFRVAPSAKDVSNFLDNGFTEHFTWPKTDPVSPYVQLMSILPADSHSLLPKCLHGLMTEKDSVLHYLYPIEFKVSLHGNRFLHECPPLLPFVDRELLTRVLAVKAPEFTPTEQARNTPGNPVVFTF